MHGLGCTIAGSNRSRCALRVTASQNAALTEYAREANVTDDDGGVRNSQVFQQPTNCRARRDGHGSEGQGGWLRRRPQPDSTALQQRVAQPLHPPRRMVPTTRNGLARRGAGARRVRVSGERSRRAPACGLCGERRARPTGPTGLHSRGRSQWFAHLRVPWSSRNQWSTHLIMDGQRGPSCGVRATGSPEKRIEKANDIKSCRSGLFDSMMSSAKSILTAKRNHAVGSRHRIPFGRTPAWLLRAVWRSVGRQFHQSR
jgi:hypothetical protein